MTAAAALLALLAGLAGSVQVAVMGRFGGRVGVLAALAFATGVQLLFAVVLLLAVRRGAGIGAAFRAPPWMWAAGLMGLLVVFSITFAQPRIGATTTIGILIAGQLAMGVADRPLRPLRRRRGGAHVDADRRRRSALRGRSL